MSEFRQDRTTGAWVIIAPERGRRPRQWHRCDIAVEHASSFDSSCPFCPGNEHLLPGIIEETYSDKPPGWRTRVVPNKYPALRPEAGSALPTGGAGPAVAGYGYHEVVIETGRHDADLATLPDSDLTAIMRAYRHRYAELMARPAVKAVFVFRNHGRHAGASLPHPHSQVIATGMTSPRLAATTAWARSRFAQDGRCVLCKELELELEDSQRVVDATERFLLAVPFAAASPFEQWVLPRRHQTSFVQCDDRELVEFGRLLRSALHRLNAVLDDPPYNYAIESGTPGDADAPCVHWRLRIVPDLVTPGGFELGAGFPINPSLPEDDAEALRAAASTAREKAT